MSDCRCEAHHAPHIASDTKSAMLLDALLHKGKSGSDLMTEHLPIIMSMKLET